MAATAPEYIASIARRAGDGDGVTLEVVVTDPQLTAGFEPEMRWLAYGFA